MTQFESDALVLRMVDVGESDVVATLLTERVGKVSAIVRGSRKGSRRIGGALEPVHGVAVVLDDRAAELATLKEARIVRLRASLVSRLEALDAAGTALRWARHLFPPRTPEPEGWRVLIELLDALDEGNTGPSQALARAGLAMLTAVGYGLELEQCIGCGRRCPEGRAACLDPARGGIVCRSCGGAATVLAPAVRDAARALAAGGAGGVGESEARAVLGAVDRAMAVHAGFER